MPAEARCAIHADHPAVDVCARCGNFVCPDCLVVSSGGVAHCSTCQARGEVDHWRVPWEERHKLGLFRGYWETTKAVMLRPDQSFGGLSPETGKWWDPLSYAIISNYLGVSGIAAFYLLMFGIGGVAAYLDKSSKSSASLGVAEAVAIVGIIVFFLVMVPIGAILGAFVWGGVEHLMLKLVGVNTRGFEATVRGACYSAAPAVLGLVPVCGSYVHPVWGIVCRIFAYRGVHKTTGGKATAAVLIPVGLCCVGGVAAYALLIAATFAATAASGK